MKMVIPHCDRRGRGATSGPVPGCAPSGPQGVTMSGAEGSAPDGTALAGADFDSAWRPAGSATAVPVGTAGVESSTAASNAANGAGGAAGATSMPGSPRRPGVSVGDG